MNNKYIGILGAGYWGNIVIKTLISLGYTNLFVCDADKNKLQTLKNNISTEINTTTNYLDFNESITHLFCLTPASFHFNICKFFLEKNVPVFCEKPLCLDLNEVETLYKFNVPLFVDWVFIYNETFNYIKTNLIPLYGNLNSIEFNRLNFGPVRYDTNALMDLSVHDLSMLFCIVNNFKKEDFTIFNYKMNKTSIQDDSNIIFYDGNIKVLIKSSWQYNKKQRDVIFNFDNNIISWDDASNKILINGTEHIFVPKLTPLQNSINTFLNNKFEDLNFNKHLTKEISKIVL